MSPQEQPEPSPNATEFMWGCGSREEEIHVAGDLIAALDASRSALQRIRALRDQWELNAAANEGLAESPKMTASERNTFASLAHHWGNRITELDKALLGDERHQQ